ncbi:tetratricopeptide repeat protein [Afifella sp. IM 167]|uniref:tetratricopeptide repeat protein n=1 Tax=Afifella sp. IM 167 TaxID=2033586 RepID=UPI001CCCCE26|nr:hypothetical protein [Afifella sp. IM 167]
MKRISLAVAAAFLVGPALAGFMAWQDHRLETNCKVAMDGCLKKMRVRGLLWESLGIEARAARWYRRGIAEHDPAAMFHLAALREAQAWERLEMSPRDWILRQRKGSAISGGLKEKVRREGEEAIAWYRRSAEAGFAPAMNNIGEAYLGGFGVVADEGEAYRWKLNAAKAGNPVGAFYLAFATGASVKGSAGGDDRQRWSELRATAADGRDLAEPTLSRTKNIGAPLSWRSRQALRMAAENGTSAMTAIGAGLPALAPAFLPGLTSGEPNAADRKFEGMEVVGVLPPVARAQ